MCHFITRTRTPTGIDTRRVKTDWTLRGVTFKKRRPIGRGTNICFTKTTYQNRQHRRVATNHTRLSVCNVCDTRPFRRKSKFSNISKQSGMGFWGHLLFKSRGSFQIFDKQPIILLLFARDDVGFTRAKKLSCQCGNCSFITILGTSGDWDDDREIRFLRKNQMRTEASPPCTEDARYFSCTRCTKLSSHE